jgi:LysM repeat protein
MVSRIARSRSFKSLAHLGPVGTVVKWRDSNTLNVYRPGAPARDAATHGPISEHVKSLQAQHPDPLLKIVEIMNAIGERIEALEAKRAAARLAPQPTHDQHPCTCAEGTLFREPDDSAVLVRRGGREVFASPTRRNARGEPDVFALTPTHDAKKDTPMSHHPGLAPRNHLSFADRLRRSFGDTSANGATYGERLPSRFDSREQARLAAYAPGAAPPSAAEINEANRKAWQRGASGQQVQDDTAEMQFNARAARAGQAPINTQYTTGTREGGHMGGVGLNQARGPGVESRSVDPNQNFAIANPFEEFANDRARPSPGAVSALNAAYNSAKSGHEREQIEQHWQSYMQASQNNTAQAQRDLWKPRQAAEMHDASPWSGIYEANRQTIGGNPNLIQPGQQLNVGGGQTHTVAKGETLSGISAQYGNPTSIGEGGAADANIRSAVAFDDANGWRDGGRWGAEQRLVERRDASRSNVVGRKSSASSSRQALGPRAEHGLGRRLCAGWLCEGHAVGGKLVEADRRSVDRVVSQIAGHRRSFDAIVEHSCERQLRNKLVAERIEPFELRARQPKRQRQGDGSEIEGAALMSDGALVFFGFLAMAVVSLLGLVVGLRKEKR